MSHGLRRKHTGLLSIAVWSPWSRKQGRGERGTAIPAMGGLAGGEGGVEEREEIGADL